MQPKKLFRTKKPFIFTFEFKTKKDLIFYLKSFLQSSSVELFSNTENKIIYIFENKLFIFIYNPFL